MLSFQRTVHACWHCVYLFREQLVFLVPLKGISFIPLVFSQVIYREQFLPHLTALRLRTNSVAQVLYFTEVRLCVEVQVVISVIPRAKWYVHGLTSNLLRNYW